MDHRRSRGLKARLIAAQKAYEATTMPLEATPAGIYAIKFKWNDGHESGIYSWEYLRRVCQCAVRR
jgi:DUF971 family protein